MKADFSKIAEIITQKGKINYFLILGLIGIMLIAVGDFDKTDKAKHAQESISLYEYKTMLEKETTDFLKEIEGVGEVKVMLSFESGAETVYVQQEKSTANSQNNSRENEQVQNNQSSYENEYVIIDSSGDDKALIEKTLQPVVKGVAVVCSGADNISVVTAVTNSVAAVLDVPTHKIYVTKMR